MGKNGKSPLQQQYVDMFTKMKKKRRRTLSDGAKNGSLQIINNILTLQVAVSTTIAEKEKKKKKTISITQIALKNGMVLKTDTMQERLYIVERL